MPCTRTKHLVPGMFASSTRLAAPPVSPGGTTHSFYPGARDSSQRGP
jgi:hypothetical protein